MVDDITQTWEGWDLFTAGRLSPQKEREGIEGGEDQPRAGSGRGEGWGDRREWPKGYVFSTSSVGWEPQGVLRVGCGFWGIFVGWLLSPWAPLLGGLVLQEEKGRAQGPTGPGGQQGEDLNPGL